MKTLFLYALLFLFSFSAFSQKQAYVIYNAKGQKVSYSKMIKTLAKQDIVLFGELHNNPISHWLQYEVTVDLHKKKDIILGAEMFEADNQIQLSNYLNDSIDKKEFDTTARFWPNYKTDYAPLVEYAKDSQIAFIATNIPRRFANKVYKNGFEYLDSLSAIEKSWVAPLPITFDPNLATYQNILKMMGKHGSPRLVMAQATKDATMAHFIHKNYVKDHLFIHYNGAFHSNYYEGILWYLNLLDSTRKYGTISTVTQEDNSKLSDENRGKADFIICVDSNMTTTY